MKLSSVITYGVIGYLIYIGAKKAAERTKEVIEETKQQIKETKIKSKELLLESKERAVKI